MASKKTEVELPKFSFDVKSVSERALRKPVDQTISIGGTSGSNGSLGTSGTSGYSGMGGIGCGGSGCAGGRGGDGFDGSSGQSGTDSEHALIWLNGTVENVNIQLTTFQKLTEHSGGINWNHAQPHSNVNYNFQLANSNGIILVNAAGGNGGEGGDGGRGGAGGRGGSGASGYTGASGSSGCGQGASGGNGSSGGPGGRGGNGGDGGRGGDGGDGGNAGAGGIVQVRSVDPRLFMLVELDCRAGKKGEGGSGGAGGSRGSGGSGGAGGRGGSGGSAGPGGMSGSCGMTGSSGSSGESGRSGSEGSNGRDGLDASNGSIQYAVVDAHGNIIETGSDKYHASVASYTITDENNDEIYEPNSKFFITNVKWTNNGAMTLPSGSILSFPSTEYITNDKNDVSVLPGILINEVLLDPYRFTCHLNAPSSPSVNQSYIQPVKITSEINLLNRSFSGSQVSTTLTCQYPIQITKIQIPTFLGPRERATVIVHFTNISARSYGACPDSAGSIEFILSTDSLIKMLPAKKGYFYKITSDGCGHYKINEQISPRSTNLIKFEIVLDDDADHRYYEHLLWNVDLVLRNKLIEKRKENIRVVPTFKPNIRTDLLLVTNSKVGRSEFLAYQNLFQLFKYSSQTWDIERYGAFHNPELKWLNTTDLIIFIYSEHESTFQTIKCQLFLQHMKSSEKAGFIAIGPGLPDELDFALFDYNNLQFIDIKQQNKYEARNHIWYGIGFKQPHYHQLKAKANKCRTDYEKQDDHNFLYQVVYDNAINTDFKRCMTVVYGSKYIYKSTLDTRVGERLVVVSIDNPLLTSSHLPFTIQTKPNANQQSEIVPLHQPEMNNQPQNHGIIQKEIMLNSNFGRLLCAMLFYQGFEKSHRIISEQHELAYSTFTIDSNKFTFNQILTSLAMSIIEREYDREIVEFQLSDQLMIQIINILGKENNPNNDHWENENDWFYLLIQSLYEYIDSKFWSSFPWCGCTIKARQRHKLQQILSDLLSISTNDIPKNKRIYPEVQILRLQKLANLSFPAADKRDMCARPMDEIRTWKAEQKLEGIPSSSSSDTLDKF